MPSPEQTAAAILTAIRACEVQRLAKQLAAQCQARFDCDALQLLQGQPPRCKRQRLVQRQLTTWRQLQCGMRAQRMPRMAQLLQDSSHAIIRQYADCPDPEQAWLRCPVLGQFGKEWYAGKVVRVDRMVQHGRRKLPLQLLVRYEDGDQAHLDEDQVQRQAAAYRHHIGRSQSRQYAELSAGCCPPAKRQRRKPQRWGG